MFVIPGLRRLGVWLGRRLRGVDRSRESLRGYHQVVLRLGG